MCKLQINEDEEEEYKELLQRTGYTGIRQKLRAVIDAWREIKIKIAVTGESGAGKSTFINSFRGLKSDDNGAAKVDAHECTREPTKYPFPNRPNMEIWDLPGFGTSTFGNKEAYLKFVGLKRYDFILLLSSNRFTANDAWLAGEILKVQNAHNLFFVRTRADMDLSGFIKSVNKVPDEEKINSYLANIKKTTSTLLKQERIPNCKVFMIDSYDGDAFDYKELVRKLIDKTDALKKEAMILSLHGITNDVINQKLKILQGRIVTISKAAGVAGAYTKRENRSYPIEVETMLEEANFYREQLGLDLWALSTVARNLDVDFEVMLVKMNMQSYRFAEREENFALHYKTYDQFRPGFVHGIPLLGGSLRTRAYQKQCAITMKAFLDLCAQDVRSLQNFITLAKYGRDSSLKY